MNKIYLFKDQEDYKKVLTKDNIINVLGTKGSGKTTSSLKYINDEKYIVINCDRLLELPCSEKEDKELSIIRKQLQDKYKKIEENNFIEPYQEIVKYILKKKKIGYIEGNIIQDLPINTWKGTIIIKRTGIVKSFKRAVKRDYRNPYFMNLEKEKHKYFYKITRLFKIIKRRKSVFKQAKNLVKIMNELDKI